MEVTQKMCGTFYFWADNLLRTENCFKIINEMSKVFKMAIKIMNDGLYCKSITFLGLCGFELFDTLSKCFGGCFRCKIAMLEKIEFKHTPQSLEISNICPRSLQDE